MCEGNAWVWDGATWSALPPADVIALDVDGTNIVVAHVEPDSCTGVAVTRFIGGDPAEAEDAGCAEGLDVTAPTAVTVLDGIILWSGDTIARL